MRGSAAERTLAAAREIAAQREGVERLYDGGVKFSKARYTGVDLEYIGKSTDNLKLGLPQRMKQDLQHVARNHNMTASHYVRKMLVQ